MAVEAGIDRPAILGIEGVGAAGEIGAGAEAAAGAGEDHGAHVVVAVGAVHRIEQFRQHLAGEGVELVRPVERDGEDAVLGLVLDLLVVHDALPQVWLISITPPMMSAMPPICLMPNGSPKRKWPSTATIA